MTEGQLTTGSGVLDRIVASKRAELEALSAGREELEARARGARLPRPVLEPLRGRGTLGVFAEVKRRSPGAGAIDPNVDPVALAGQYEAGGAAAVSVLTDGPYFGGSLLDLERVGRAVRVPVLRKDFVIDELQVLEARGAGADIVLLIARVLDPATLRSLRALVHDLGMVALVEVHEPWELDAALDSGAELLGVNNRDLTTFTTDLSVTEAVAPLVPSDVLLVSESGIRTVADAARAAAAGADAVLVGEALVREDRPAEAVARLAAVERQRRPS